jgi:hypothetical protein
MRDIRPDLEERLKEARAEVERLQSELREAQNLEESLASLFEHEEQKWANLHRRVNSSAEEQAQARAEHNGKTPLAKFVLSGLEDGEIHTSEDLAEQAVRRSFPFGDKSARRSIHFALVGMAQNGIVESLGSGRWRLKK